MVNVLQMDGWATIHALQSFKWTILPPVVAATSWLNYRSGVLGVTQPELSRHVVEARYTARYNARDWTVLAPTVIIESIRALMN